MSRGRSAATLGLTGGILGVVAGAVQAAAGPRIPQWTGDKASPVALGLLTIGLSVLAGIAAVVQRHPGLSVRARAAAAVGLAVPALLGLSTVGRLWYLPAVLLLLAAAVSIDSWKDTAAAVARDWLRILLSALGLFEILMAARATPVLMATGIIGGIALVAAAWQRTAGRAVGFVVLGTVPFAALAWTAVVPVLLALTAAVLAVPVIRSSPAPIERSLP